MKILATLLIACCINSITWANILTVSANTAYPAQYSSVQSAINAASAGDTVYLYPSYYAEYVTLNKRLVIIGPGIDPRRPNRLPAYIGGVFTISSSSASGSVLMGIYFYAVINSGSDANLVNNLVVSDCRFDGNAIFYGNNLLIENCILYANYPTGGEIQFPVYNTIGNIIQNNYIHGFIKMRPGTNTIIRNNTFASGDANTYSFSDLQYGEPFGPAVKIQNNIFYKSDPIGLRGVADASEFKNNIYYLTSDPTPSNALSSGNMNANPLFVSFPAGGAGFSFQYDFHLLPGSPAINYGIDGKDLGMWGGSVPVNAGFEPPIPRIYELTVNNATVPAGGTIQLTIKATKAQ